MLFQVLKAFRSNGASLERGEVVDLPSSPRTQQLIEQRYLLPSDAKVATITAPATLTSPSAKRRGRPPANPAPEPSTAQD